MLPHPRHRWCQSPPKTYMGKTWRRRRYQHCTNTGEGCTNDHPIRLVPGCPTCQLNDRPALCTGENSFVRFCQHFFPLHQHPHSTLYTPLTHFFLSSDPLCAFKIHSTHCAPTPSLSHYIASNHLRPLFSTYSLFLRRRRETKGPYSHYYSEPNTHADTNTNTTHHAHSSEE